MSYTYKLKGTRWLRKYTAQILTPSTSAGSDAEAIASNLCLCPWEKSPADFSEFPGYGTKEVDDNAGNREFFDTAEWCAEHTEGSRHRCYANACYYRFAIPAASQGKVCSTVRVKVVCDPYTPQGARISVATTSSETLPTECSDVRTGDVHAEGVAPRLAVTNASGVLYWYENTETKELAFDRELGAYLDVFIGLETWRARNGWLEGAARIASVEIDTDEELEGLTTSGDGTVDMRSTGEEWPVCRNGVLPRAAAENHAVLTVQRNLAGDALADGVTDPEASDAESTVGLSAVYAAFYAKELTAVGNTLATDAGARTGAAFTVRNWRVARPDGTARPVWQLTLSSLAVPFACPKGSSAGRIRLAWTGLRATAGHMAVWLKRGAYLAEVPADTLANPALYKADETSVDDWIRVGKIAAAAGDGSAEFEIDALTDDVATILLTAWCPPDAIDFDEFLPQGVGALNVDAANGTAGGFDTCWKPDITLVS